MHAREPVGGSKAELDTLHGPHLTHRAFRENSRSGRIAFVPDPTCCPRALRRQPEASLSPRKAVYRGRGGPGTPVLTGRKGSRAGGCGALDEIVPSFRQKKYCGRPAVAAPIPCSALVSTGQIREGPHDSAWTIRVIEAFSG